MKTQVEDADTPIETATLDIW